MIQDFHVSNFYSIREQQSISFAPSDDSRLLDEYTFEVKPGVRLLRLGVIYGANASGKTTVLNALDFFRRIMSTRPAAKEEGMRFLPFMLDNESREQRTKMQMSFFVEGERHILSIEFDRQRIYTEQLSAYITNRPMQLYQRQYSPDTDHSVVTFGAKTGLSRKSQQVVEGNTTRNCTVLAALGQSNVESNRLTRIYEYFSNSMKETQKPRIDIPDYVKSALRRDTDNELKLFLLKVLRASDFNITDFRLEKQDRTDNLIFQHTADNGAFHLNELDESAGTKRFMGMAVMLHTLLCDNTFLSIDEVESSIHYELLSYFVKLFLVNSEGSSQLLMTTHDINLLNEDFIRRDVVWFTDKNSCGSTLLKRLSTLGLHKTLSPYHAYQQGKLVKLPFLGSIYLEQN